MRYDEHYYSTRAARLERMLERVTARLQELQCNTLDELLIIEAKETLAPSRHIMPPVRTKS